MKRKIKDFKMKKIVIAVDGYSSCGKSTFAKSIAAKLGYIFIDTGAMYRAVTLFAIENNMATNGTIDNDALEGSLKGIEISFNFDNEHQKSFVYLNGTNVESKIRGVEVSSYVSIVSQNLAVRTLLVELQQGMGRSKGIIMDGRDIGTTVFPDAELKIFMTASVDVRAQRRFNELTLKGDKVSFDEIKQNIESRDYLDQTREISPLRMADDAILLDNSDMTVTQQMDWGMQKIDAIIN